MYLCNICGKGYHDEDWCLVHRNTNQKHKVILPTTESVANVFKFYRFFESFDEEDRTSMEGNEEVVLMSTEIKKEREDITEIDDFNNKEQALELKKEIENDGGIGYDSVPSSAMVVIPMQIKEEQEDLSTFTDSIVFNEKDPIDLKEEIYNNRGSIDCSKVLLLKQCHETDIDGHSMVAGISMDIKEKQEGVSTGMEANVFSKQEAGPIKLWNKNKKGEIYDNLDGILTSSDMYSNYYRYNGNNRKYRKLGHHTQSPDKVKRFKCNICVKSYSFYSNLWAHKQTHKSAEKRFKCDVCEKSYTSMPNLRDHKQRHESTGNQRFRCDLCEKSYSYSSNLRVHKQTHKNTINRFKCDVCEKSYTCVRNLQNHKQKHENTGNHFRCDTCEKSFSCSKYLQQHKRWHKNTANRFKCDVCEKSYSTSHYLQDHKQWHDNISNHRFKCDICEKLFSTIYYARQHKRTHVKSVKHESGNNRKKEVINSQQLIKVRKTSFEEELTTVSAVEADVAIKMEINPVEHKSDPSPEEFLNSKYLKNVRRTSFEEEQGAVTSAEMEMVAIKIEIKQE